MDVPFNVNSTYDRFNRAVHMQLGNVREVGNKLYHVPSEHNHDPYLVNLGSTVSCNCEDFYYRGAEAGIDCKHIIAAKIYVAMRQTFRV